MIQKKTIGFLLIAILVLNFLDAITTYHALSNGISKEYNPLFSYIIRTLGLDNAMIFKVFFVVFVSIFTAIVINWLYKQYETCDSKKKKTTLKAINQVTFMAIFLVFLFTFVVVGNTFVILGIIRNP